MNKDQSYGAVIFAVSFVGLILYAWLLWVFPVVMLQITAFAFVALIAVIAAWIGWTMLTTPPPAPLETISSSEPAADSEQQKPAA